MTAGFGEHPAVARRRVRLALRKARRSAGLNQGDVADRLGWSLSKAQRIEAGEVAVSITDLRALVYEHLAATEHDPLRASGTLVDWANAQGGHDNITVALARAFASDKE